MKLLNLWPIVSTRSTSSKLRLWQEVTFAILCVVLMVCAVWLILQRHLKQIQSVNAALVSELATLQKQDSTHAQTRLLMNHRKQEGQLNWLAVLPEVVDGRAQLTQVVQLADGQLSLQGRADSAQAAQTLIQRAGQVFNQGDVRVVSLASKQDEPRALWLFEIHVHDAVVLNQDGLR